VGKKKIIDDNFIMSPKVDFTFKLLFGDPKNKDLLIALLSAVLGLPEEQFADIEIINTELLREFKEDKKGILDVRVRTKEGKQIDIEIQILPTEFMAERTIFYLAKMYTSQIKSGDTYDMLKKCITINIVDFPCTPLKKLHSKYHLTEDEKARMLYDARNAEITDQLTRIKSAEKKGIEIGEERKAIKDAESFLKLGVPEGTVAEGTGLSIEVVRKIKRNMEIQH